MSPPPRIKVVVVAPGKPAATVVVPNTLASFRHFVGGYLEIYAPAALRERGMYGYINEDGHRLELTPNFPGVNGPVLGTIVVSAADAAGDEVGLDDVQAAFAARYFDTLRRLPSESERPRQHPEGPCGMSDDNLRSLPLMATVNRAYKFRLYPTDVQSAELAEWERQLRRLYNLAQEQRLSALLRPRVPHDRGECPSCGAVLPKRKGDRPVKHTAACAWVDYYRQSREMTPLVDEDDQLSRVICCARQEVLRDLDKAWQRWRKRLGGRPRFKRRTDLARIYFSTPKHWHVDGATLTLTGKASSVGPLKIRQDRPWPGDAKFSSCHIVRDVDEWYAVFPLEFTAPALDKPVTDEVGINRGAIHTLADSDGRIVDSPRYYERALDRVRLLGRRLSRKLAAAKALGLKPGKNAHKARVKLARKHQLVRRQREWFLHEQSAHYTRYALVGIEDLSTRQIVADPKVEEAAHWSNRCKRDGCDEKVVKRRLCQKHFDEVRRIPKRAVHRSILDAGWYELARQLKYKGEATGTRVVTVNPGLFDPEQPAGISKTCSRCGAALGAAASGHAVATCDRCGLIEHGDINAATNVLRRALSMPPPVPKAPMTIKIKGRAKAQTETIGKPPIEACGGDAPVRAPVEAGTLPREGEHSEHTVLPTQPGRQRSPPTHQAKETRD